MPRTVTVKFSDGTSHIYKDVPDEITPDQISQRASADFAGKELVNIDGGKKAPAGPPTGEERALHEARLAKAEEDLATETGLPHRAERLGRNIAGYYADTMKAGADQALSLGSQIVMTPIAGLTGLVAAPFVGSNKAANVTRTIAEAAYTPKSEVGQQAAEQFAKPFVAFAEKADQAGDFVAQKTGSPLLGTITNTTIQGIPAVATRGARAPFVSAGRAATGAVRRAVGAAPSATEAAAAAGAQAADASALTAAQNQAQAYARTLGLDWDRLGGELRQQLSTIARTAGELERLDPEAVKRLALLQSNRVPVPATRGAITRDTGQLLREDVAKSTPEGAPVLALRNAGDNALQANLDLLKGRVSGSGATAATARTGEEAGAKLQGAARAKEAQSRANYNELYKKARETEPNARASVAPITELLTTNPEIQHLGWVQTWLNRAAKLAGGKGGEPVAITEATLAELDDLRKLATANAKSPGDKGFYAKQVSQAIDQAMQDVPAASKAWAAARDAFKRHKMEFEEQGAVADLVDQSTRTDRATALESTVRTITNGSLEDIRKVKKTLLTGGDETTRTAGRQAWRELRAKVVERIKSEATKSAQEKADGTPNLSVAKLKQVIDSYGPEKLEEIFGAGTTRELNRILDSAKVVKYAPADLGSNTTNKIVAFLSKGLEKIPGGGKVVDVARGVGKLKDLGANARAAESARTLPLDEAAKAAAAKARNNVRRRDLGAAKTLPISSLVGGAREQ